MKLEQHEENCLKNFGKPFSEVHRYLDHYFREYHIAHRRLLHHRLGIEMIVKLFGEVARKAAEQHIIDDFGLIPHSWIEHDEYTVYLNPGDEEKQQIELENLFGTELIKMVEEGADFTTVKRTLHD